MARRPKTFGIPKFQYLVKLTGTCYGLFHAYQDLTGKPGNQIVEEALIDYITRESQKLPQPLRSTFARLAEVQMKGYYKQVRADLEVKINQHIAEVSRELGGATDEGS